jgi:CheY-like chemotaxis protein
MLKREGYQVLLADGPRQALEIVKNNPPVHLVVSDMMMPELRGTQLIREISRLSPQTAAVLMTGSFRPVDVPDGVPVLKKPFSTRELLSAVQAILARSAQWCKSSRERELGAVACGAVPVGLPARQLLDAGWSYRINTDRGWIIYRDPATGLWHTRDEAIRILETADTVSLVGFLIGQVRDRPFLGSLIDVRGYKDWSELRADASGEC